MPNLRSAMIWANQVGEPLVALRIALGIYPYLLATDALREALRWLVPGLEHVDVPQSLEEAQGLAAAQSAAFYIADEGRAAEFAHRVQAAVDRVADPEQQAEPAPRARKPSLEHRHRGRRRRIPYGARPVPLGRKPGLVSAAQRPAAIDLPVG